MGAIHFTVLAGIEGYNLFCLIKIQCNDLIYEYTEPLILSNEQRILSRY